MAEIGAIASVIGIAGAGAKLSIALFDFASTIGSVATEITAIGIEISQFCVVVKQIELTLTKARKTVRYSISALLAIEQVTGQCQFIFEKIEEILRDLKKDKAKPNFLSRLKWTLKRSKVQMLQKTLEASKLTLSCMLMKLLFAENVSSRSITTIETQKEDEHQKVVTQSLLVARQCAVNELENLEDSTPLEHPGSEFSSSVENMAEPQSLSPGSREMRSPNRHSRIMDGVLQSSFPMSGDTYHRRSSVLLNEVMPGDPAEMRRLTWEDALSSSYIRTQPVHLLRKWTEDGTRLSKLVVDNQATPQEHYIDHYNGEEHPITRLGTISNVEMRDNIPTNPSFNVLSGSPVSPKRRQRPYSHHKSMSEPSTARGSHDPLQDQNSDLTGIGNVKQGPVAIKRLASVENFKMFRVSMEDPCSKVLPAALKKYNINAPWEHYALYIICGDQERCLERDEKPVTLFKQLDKEGKKPMFMLRKTIFHPDAAGATEILPSAGLDE